MLDLISTTEETHYENYRQQQMETRKFGEPKVKKLDNPKFKEEEETLRKRFTEQVKLEESRFRQWEQHVCYLIVHLHDIGFQIDVDNHTDTFFFLIYRKSTDLSS